MPRISRSLDRPARRHSSLSLNLNTSGEAERVSRECHGNEDSKAAESNYSGNKVVRLVAFYWCGPPLECRLTYASGKQPARLGHHYTVRRRHLEGLVTPIIGQE